MFAKLFFVLALFGLLHVAPAHADDSFEDASQALDNLGELVESVDRVGRSLDRIIQPRQEQLRWYGGERPRRSDGWSQWRVSNDYDDHDDDRDE